MTELVVAARVAATAVEGPHLRSAIWVAGCSLRCPGCCNPHMFEPGRGTRIDVARLLEDLAGARDRHRIEGVTVVGGEPLQQLPGVTALATGAQQLGLGVLVFTGYTESEARRRSGFDALWAAIDTLVTGRYDRTRPEPADGRRFIGSTNQRRIHRTTRYRDASCWRGEPAAELHFDPDGQPRVLGDPAAARPVIAALRRRRA